MTPARELASAVLGCLTGAAVVLLAAGRPWAHGEISRGPGVPVDTVDLTGRELAPAATGLALLALAAVAAFVATRGSVRRGIGLLVLAAGAGLVFTAAAAGSRATAVVATAAPDATSIDVGLAPWPWVAAAGGVLVATAGLVTLLRGAAWPTMSRRYDVPPADQEVRRSTEHQSARESGSPTPEDMWRDLDRGDDPTR